MSSPASPQGEKFPPSPPAAAAATPAAGTDRPLVTAAGSSVELPVIGAATAALAAQPASLVPAGTLVGNYRLKEPLGRGSMGETYLAEHPQSGDVVAIKFLANGASARWTARFEREIRCQSSVQSPFTVGCLGAGLYEGRRYMILQYVAGANLHVLLKQLPDRRMSEERALRIAYQVLKAIQALESQGYLHRDIKPQNVLISHQDAVHLSDFGLVKDLHEPLDTAKPEAERRITPPNTTLGTAEYMSPEQSLGAELDLRSDLYSFGAVLYRLLTGQAPFRGESTAKTLELLIQQPLTPVRALNPDVTSRTAALVETLLQKKRSDRPRTSQQVETELLACFKEIRDSVRIRAIEEEVVKARTRAPLTVGLAIVGLSFLIGFVTALVIQFMR